MRRLGLAVAFVAGCSFSPGTYSAPGSTTDDASSPSIDDAAIDAPPDGPPPSWQVVETITVDSRNETPETSMTVLASGVTYRLRASGTLSATIDGLPGDAEYWDFTTPKDLGCCEDIGIGIDDTDVDDKITLPDWGPYTATHVYEAEWIGEGRAITALFQDTQYSNNQGSLTLEILEYK